MKSSSVPMIPPFNTPETPRIWAEVSIPPRLHRRWGKLRMRSPSGLEGPQPQQEFAEHNVPAGKAPPYPPYLGRISGALVNRRRLGAVEDRPWIRPHFPDRYTMSVPDQPIVIVVAPPHCAHQPATRDDAKNRRI